MSSGDVSLRAFVHFEWIDAAGDLQDLTFDCTPSEDWDEGATVTEHPVEEGANVADHVRVMLPKYSVKVRSTNEPIDSNQFAIATTGPLALNVPSPKWTPGPGVVVVPTWQSGIDLRALAGSLGAALAGTAGGLGVTAAILASGALQGHEVDVPVQTGAGLPSPAPTPPVVAQTQQWPGGMTGVDYVEKTHALLVQLKDAAQLLIVFTKTQIEYDMVIEQLTFHRDDQTGTGEDITIGLKKVRLVSTQTVAAPIPDLPAGGGKLPTNHGGQDPKEAKQSVAVSGIKTAKAFIGGLLGGHP
jgi:hypothetical protein